MLSQSQVKKIQENILSGKPADLLGPRSLLKLLMRSLVREINHRSHWTVRTAMHNLSALKPTLGSKNKASRNPAKHAQVPPPERISNSDDLAMLNEWFDRVVVFTIPRNESSRLVQLREELKPINYEIYYGIDQKDHTPEQLRRILRDLGSNPPEDANPAMMAHNAGFLRLLHETVDRKIEKTLFIEDDFVFAPYAAAVFKQARLELESEPINANWDLLHFHSHLPCTPPDMALVGGNDVLFYPVLPEQAHQDGLDWYAWSAASLKNPDQRYRFKGGRQYIMNAQGQFLKCVFRGYFEHLSSLCLGIHLNGAKKILANTIPWRPSDHLCGTISESHNHRTYIVSPFPCHPRPLESSFQY